MSKLYENDIVLSSRIRLARNLSCVNFPLRESDVEAKFVIENLKNCLLCDFNYYPLLEMSETELMALVEKHVISKELVDNKDIGGYFYSSRTDIVVMANEEDHIREQLVIKGFDLDGCYQSLKQVDQIIVKNLDVAKDENLGYLTSCPSNLGTGLRASVMMFLPALSILGGMKEILSQASHDGLTIRGYFGEGTKAYGYMYQLSNQITLGLTCEEIIEKVKTFTNKIITLESDAREGLVETKLSDIKNTSYRAFGVLTHSYMMSTSEMYLYLSQLRLGVVLELLELKNPNIINDLIEKCSPYVMMLSEGKTLSSNQRDIKRAEILSKSLSNMLIV